MPPVLTPANENYDYEPCFFLDADEEDFYPPPRCQLLPGPSEDIWKKFELMPTPPLSPRRQLSLGDVPLAPAEHLEGTSDLLEDACNPSSTFLQSFIIQDCMWSSSFAAATKLERAVSARLASLRARRDVSSAKVAGDCQVGGPQANPGYLQDLSTAAADCIDPSAVFPYSPPQSAKSRDGTPAESRAEVCANSPPPSSSSSSSSDSESEEDEYEGEIDVVTVDRRRTSDSTSDSSALILKRSHVSIHQHNYAAQQPPAAHHKRLRTEDAAPLRQSATHKGWCSWSDGEDGDDKRRTHNVLERQRRNELRRSFLALRDQIPAVANNDKAAKVSILKRAAEFIAQVRAEEAALLAEKEALRRRSLELKERLQRPRTEPL